MSWHRTSSGLGKYGLEQQSGNHANEQDGPAAEGVAPEATRARRHLSAAERKLLKQARMDPWVATLPCIYLWVAVKISACDNNVNGLLLCLSNSR